MDLQHVVSTPVKLCVLLTKENIQRKMGQQLPIDNANRGRFAVLGNM